VSLDNPPIVTFIECFPGVNETKDEASLNPRLLNSELEELSIKDSYPN
jgi:hypothetical protein